MNPENNNPYQHPGAPLPGAAPSHAPSVDNMMSSDSMSSATDTLTSAGMAASTGHGVMDLQHLGMDQPGGMYAQAMDEPLTPAAPVPGSIGSVTSVPLPAYDPMSGYLPNVMPNAHQVQPAQPAPTPAPQPAPAPAHEAPYNPFATPPAEPKPEEKPETEPEDKPKMPKLPKPTLSIANKLPLPMILLGVLAAALLISTVVLFILWQKALATPRIIYTPTVSPDQGSAKVEVLSCTREVDYDWLINYGRPVPGSETLTVNYAGGELGTLSLDFNTSFDNEADAATARDNLAANQAELMAAIGGSFAAAYDISGQTLAASIRSLDSGINAADLQVLAYGKAEGQDTALAALQAQYEANGYTCKVE